ncbi:hypothetical protein DL95DRAFT_396645 [Leptodontidium sp. 2 PMI_412]|nr:hypothetical protein BKA61DRAFT_623296 [Leptodontidium sp. MPI-SDFR-AT-0119]KAH9206772.1 hypothetical protein DL95DRAFT_396645 [Leptodontidium sp. 2 PMI_412]
MSASESSETPNSKEVSKRPYVVTYLQKPDFHVGDKVYLLNSSGSRTGPYVIASIPSAGKCTLSLEDGTAVENSKEIDVDYVEAV